MNFFAAAPGEQWFRFLRSTPDQVVFLTTPEGVIREWLGAAERVTGYTAEEAIGQSISIFFPAHDRELGLDVHEIELVHLLGVAECDRWNVRKDGSQFWASGMLTAIRGDDGKVVALCKVMRDKTDVRYQIQWLENRLAQRDAEASGTRAFLTATAHELRNPLMPILSAVTLLKRTDAPHMSGRALQIVENQVGVLKRLIDDLTSKVLAPQAGAALSLERTDLCDALRSATAAWTGEAAERQIQFSLVLPPADIWIAADPARLQQILLNLLSNAFKYTRSGGSIGVSASTEANMGTVRIEDDGIGISPDVLPHIFELFTREGRQQEIEGLGVGLSVVNDLVTQHGGLIEARSPGPDKGSVFGLRLPLWQMPVDPTD